MKIAVDRDLCQGHAACVQEAPELFALDPATSQVVVKNESPEESQRADAKRAIKYCPTRALRLEEDWKETPMAAFPRAELEDMIRRFVAENNRAGTTGDWSKLSQFYADDALYTWNVGQNWEFAARGRKEIHDIVFGAEMRGLESWVYPYVRTLIDDRKGEVIGIWRQIAPETDPEGKPYEIAGTGGSWFRYAGNGQWAWQRDFFDHINAGAVFGALAKAGKLSPQMVERMKKGSNQPGWIPRNQLDWYATIVDRED